MPRFTRLALGLALLLTLASCAASNAAGAGASGRRDTLTREQIADSRYTNMFEVVQALRSNWMHDRGSDTLTGRPSVVQVYLDDQRVGGVEALRAISTSTVAYVRFFDGITASGRWGLDHGKGVIFVSTREER